MFPTSAKEPTPVTRIALHPCPHLDEAVGVFVLQNYGQELFPGAEDASFVFWRDGKTPDRRTADEWMKRGVIPVGVGNGPFDEHRPAGRLKDACAATLVADYLGVSNRPELVGLLLYTLGMDDQAIAQPFSLGTIVKDVNLLYEEDPAAVIQWALRAIAAYVDCKLQSTPVDTQASPPSVDLVLAHFLCQNHTHYGATEIPRLKGAIQGYLNSNRKTPPVEWLKEHFGEFRKEQNAKHASVLLAQLFGLQEHSSFKHLLGYVTNPRAYQKSKHPLAPEFELPALIEAIFRASSNNSAEALHWATVVIAAKVYASELFNQAGEEYANATVETIPTPTGDRLLVWVESDNPKMMAFSHSSAAEKLGRKADIFVQRRTSGHTSIFANPETKLHDAVRLLRMQEMQARNWRILPTWNELGKDGDGPDGVYFYFGKPQHIYNGSNSAPEVPVTRLPLERIVHTLKFSLNPRAFPGEFATQCLAGNCCSTRSSPCPVYPAGLLRCRQIRFGQVQQEFSRRWE